MCDEQQPGTSSGPCSLLLELPFPQQRDKPMASKCFSRPRAWAPWLESGILLEYILAQPI